MILLKMIIIIIFILILLLWLFAFIYTVIELIKEIIEVGGFFEFLRICFKK